MTIRYPTFLPGVPEQLIRTALAKAGGNEINSGKLDSPESSAALAVNAFGWFLERPADLPSFPPLAELDWPAVRVNVERQMRFPWSGGRHPWLDGAVETATHLIGVESKRFEPFRDAKTVKLSDAYDRNVWGERMTPFTAMRDRLRSGGVGHVHLDAVQLVKHAFGLVTEGRRLGKTPVLLYLYAEPTHRGATVISATAIEFVAEGMYNAPYWRLFWKIAGIVPGLAGQPDDVLLNRFAWTNISKTGVVGRSSPPDNDDHLRQLDIEQFTYELNLLQPDLLVCVSGSLVPSTAYALFDNPEWQVVEGIQPLTASTWIRRSKSGSWLLWTMHPAYKPRAWFDSVLADVQVVLDAIAAECVTA